jgi:putative ATP-binding cassette transporter
MDEATSALDPDSQTKMMSLLADRLPDVAVISISHRPELAVFHDRQLRFEHRPGGSRLVSDIALPPSKRRVGNLRSRLSRLGGRTKHAPEPPHAGKPRASTAP